ncbi:LysR substrate-binding domain-containing protein [Dasania marina]|uniref:LysR substrate-binding domain-containing protein n=1 Tax=Dasania marina TaxID=471499 RepID=UPI00035E1AE2|nr:LysR substrate-binding domain-containing protein [Dasania marina]
MKRKLPPLNSLLTFEAVGRNRSLGKAAAELFVTHSAVSHQIRNLEDRLNTQLFAEKGKNTTLTPQGRLLLESLTASFNNIQKTISSFSDSEAPQHLRIATSTAIASSSIPMYAAEFIREQKLSDFSWMAIEDLDDEEVDLVISWKNVHIPGEVDVTQIPINYFLICSPELLNGLPPPQTLADLKNHTLIHGDKDGAEWQRFLSLLGSEDITPQANLFLGNTFVAHQAARNGCGIALGDEIMVDQDLRTGALICPLPHLVPAPAPIKIITPFHSRNNEVAQEFKEWFIRKVSLLTKDLKAKR